jgi:hypothetical protein
MSLQKHHHPLLAVGKVQRAQSLAIGNDQDRPDRRIERSKH